GDASICSGGSTTLTFAGDGVFPLTVTYSDGVGQNTVTINSPQPVLLDVSPAVTTVYSLISVSDGTVPVCGTQLSQSATVTIQQSVTAGIANEPVELCAGTSLPLQLINFLTGADP